MAKGRKIYQRSHPLKYVEAYLRNKKMRQGRQREHPMDEPLYSTREGGFLGAPNTEVITMTLAGHATIYQAGFTHQGGNHANLGTINAVGFESGGPDYGENYRVDADEEGIQRVNTASALPHDRGAFTLWVRSHIEEGDSGNDFDYVLSISKINEDATPAYEESLIIRWEPIAEELRLYPDITNFPADYIVVPLPTADWYDITGWHQVRCVWNFQEQEWTLCWDSIEGTRVGANTIAHPVWDEFTWIKVFTDLDDANNIYHDCAFVSFGEIIGPIAAGGVAGPGGDDTQVQYNNAGTLAGAAGLIWNRITNRLGINRAPGKSLDLESQGAGDGFRIRSNSNQDRFLAFTVGGANGPMRVQLYDNAGALQARFNATGESYVGGGNFWIQSPYQLKGGVTFHLTYNVGLVANDIDAIITLRTWQDETVLPAAFFAQVDFCRTISATVTNMDPFTATTGTITINGINGDGVIIQEVITVNVAALSPPITYETNRAFNRITSVVIDQTDVHMLDTYMIGVADGIGVTNIPLNAAGDIFKVCYNGVDVDPAVFVVNTTYGTVHTGIVLQPAFGGIIEVCTRPWR